MIVINRCKSGPSATTTMMMIGLVVFSYLCHTINAFMGGLPSLPRSHGVAPRARSEIQSAPISGSRSSSRGGYGRQSIIMMPSSAPLVPYKAPGTDYHRYVDIYQRLYYDRVLLCGQFIDDSVANNIMSILWYLNNQDKTKPIYMYFNIPGALLRPALSVFDTMEALPCEIEAVNIGLTTGMGAFLCAAGTKGRRYALPNSRFLMQKTGFEEQVYGQASDIVLEVENSMQENGRFLKELSRLTGRTLDQVKEDFKRDFYLSAEESVEYGMVDHVIYPGHKDPLSVGPQQIGFGKFVSGADQKYQPQFMPDAWA